MISTTNPKMQTEHDDDNQNEQDDYTKNQITIVKDRYNQTYIIFFILGIGTLIPYNFFIIANKYFNYKFRPLNDSIADGNDSTTNFLQVSFVNVSNISANISTTLLIILNTVYGYKIKTNYRLFTTGLCILLLFILTTIFVKINTDTWQYGFYVLTIVTIVLINANAGVYGCTTYGYASILPPIYTQAICMGQVAAGLFTATAQILTNVSAPDPVDSGLMFFSIGCLIIFINLVCFAYVQNTAFVRHYEAQKNSHLRSLTAEIVAEGPTDLTPLLESNEFIGVVQPPGFNCDVITQLFKQCWFYLLTLYFVNIVTSSIYPGLAAAVKSTHYNENRFYTDFFTPVMFIIQNVSDMLGRILCGLAPLAVHRRGLIGLFSYTRVVLIALFCFCNIQPRFSHDYVYFGDAWFYSFIGIGGFTNGYLSTVCLMHIPKLVDSSLSELLSSLAQLLLMLGIVAGSVIAFVITTFI